MRLSNALRVGLVACALVLGGCIAKLEVDDASWTAECGVVAFDDCQGVLELFVGNLARNHAWIYEESGGFVRIEPASCPAELHPDTVPFLDLSSCWPAQAPMHTTRACMIVARQKDPSEAFGSRFGQAGGDSFTGLLGAPKPGTTPC